MHNLSIKIPLSLFPFIISKIPINFNIKIDKICPKIDKRSDNNFFERTYHVK